MPYITCSPDRDFDFRKNKGIHCETTRQLNCESVSHADVNVNHLPDGGVMLSIFERVGDESQRMDICMSSAKALYLAQILLSYAEAR